MFRFPAILAAFAFILCGHARADDLPPARSGGADDQALLAIPEASDAKPLDPAIVAAFTGAAEAYGTRDFRAARAAWADLARDGFAPAQYNLAVMLEHGRGGTVDYAAAAEWYARAADQDVAQAMINLARLHFEGRGVKRDPSEGLRRLRMAAMLDAPRAAYNLGVAYLKGMGTKADAAEAANWFGRAADAGHGPAAYNLAVLYRDGRGVERDRARARTLFAKAADNGDAFARYAFADMLIADAKGDVRGIKVALDHLRRAAEAGVTVAQNRLAIVLAKGEGTKRDPETALMWFHVAAGMGADNAAKNRDALAATLDDATRAKAKRRADAFQPNARP